MDTGRLSRARDWTIRRLGVKKSANSQIVLGEPSTMNSRTWWTSGYHKLHSSLPQSSVEYDFGTCGDLAVFAASVRGAKHQFKASPNQDAFAVCCVESPHRYIVLAVSDGVSSAEYSAYSSRRLARDTVARLSSILQSVDNNLPSDGVDSKVFSDVITQSSEAVRSWATSDLDAPRVQPQDVRPSSLAATLALVLIDVSPNKDGSFRARAGLIGDSPIFLSSQDRYEIQSVYKKGGAVVENSTDALPLADGESLELSWLDFAIPAGAHLLVTTDGFSNVLRDGNTKFAPIIHQLFVAPKGAPEQLSHLAAVDFDRRGEDDDRTAVVVWAPPFRNSSPEGSTESSKSQQSDSKGSP